MNARTQLIFFYGVEVKLKWDAEHEWFAFRFARLRALDALATRDGYSFFEYTRKARTAVSRSAEKEVLFFT